MSSSGEEQKKKKKSKKRKSNQSSVDFVIVSQDNEVKEVVKKKKDPNKGKDSASSRKGQEDKDDEKKRKENATREDEPKRRKREDQKLKGEDEPSTKKVRASGVTRLFVGNLPWSIDDRGLEKALECALPVIKYITDKDTKQFYGSAFVECADTAAAEHAVALSGTKVGGRQIKVAFAPPRPGDVWPPKNHRPKAQRPADGTNKLFLGNVAYEAEEEDVLAHFSTVAPDGFKAIRWLTDKHSGDFRGSGFLEFYSVEQADAAINTLNGTDLKGRPIRLDYA
ncbi:hypothetical protein CTAYLR_000907 [Chrysophaeum taylorii]|uniref:RRM domain-containing protein n=1 Tax=Chrysophaeum taylorii TaxID=2483200 RepID=A0AAD7UFF7_9STRA|nr:hypothetical protein CTAYLR_000907 [Chrysophaeum taylorii]